MQIVIQPLATAQAPIDVTDRLVGAIAEELWLRFGGNEALNWLEAERHLAAILDLGGVDGERVAGSGASPRLRATQG